MDEANAEGGENEDKCKLCDVVLEPAADVVSVINCAMIGDKYSCTISPESISFANFTIYMHYRQTKKLLMSKATNILLYYPTSLPT